MTLRITQNNTKRVTRLAEDAVEDSAKEVR